MPLTERLYECLPGVYKYALRLTGDSHAAEDLTQEAALRAWQKQDLLRQPGSLRFWLLRVVSNLWRDQLRRCHPATPGPEPFEPAGWLQPPDYQAIQQDDARQALQTLDSLPDRQRQVLYLLAVEQLSITQISDLLGISKNAVKTSLSLARKRMRQVMTVGPGDSTKQRRL